MMSDLPRGRTQNWALAVLAAAAVLLFFGAQISISSVNGWWNDEFYALWASDKSIPFSVVFSERIFPDTNPPLYFSALYLARLLVDGDREAVLLLNVGFLVIALLCTAIVSRRAHLTALAVIGGIAFSLSGPVLAFVAEGRSYLAALALSFVAAWCVAIAVEEPDSRPSLPIFAVLGAVGALTHVYAALFCGALAAGLLSLALWDARWRATAGDALALGLSASLVLGVWILLISTSLDRVDWIEFSRSSIVTAAWYVKDITVGSRILGVLLIALLSISLVNRRTRPLVVVFGIAFGLFVLLPLIISFKKPIISGRYWVIGAPGIIVLLTFLARAWLRETSSRGFGWGPVAVNLGIVVLVCGATISGYSAARASVASKSIWRGAEIAGPLLRGCPAGSVHVGRGKIEGGGPTIAAFALAGGAPASVFVDAGAVSTGSLEISAARCTVLGWAEHLLLGDDFPTQAPETELLRVLKIDAAPRDVEVRRHQTGFVLLKRQ